MRDGSKFCRRRRRDSRSGPYHFLSGLKSVSVSTIRSDWKNNNSARLEVKPQSDDELINQTDSLRSFLLGQFQQKNTLFYRISLKEGNQKKGPRPNSSTSKQVCFPFTHTTRAYVSPPLPFYFTVVVVLPVIEIRSNQQQQQRLIRFSLLFPPRGATRKENEIGRIQIGVCRTEQKSSRPPFASPIP